MNPDAQYEQPRVGVAAILIRDGRVLLGQRIGSHGAGSWALPGGHLEFGETPEDCARREVLEETGLVVATFERGPFVSDVFAAERRHYVTLFVMARDVEGEPAIVEPDKCLGWQWFDWSALPAPLFLPLATLRASGFAVPDAGAA
jgi:8-oxo-dGTP diphosphatase